MNLNLKHEEGESYKNLKLILIKNFKNNRSNSKFYFFSGFYEKQNNN